MARRSPLPLLILGVAASACTSFSTVRSAEVHPGPSLTVQGSISTPPGDEPAWFWSLDCASECDHPIGGFDLGFTYGQTEGASLALGAGVSGLLYPYVDGYLQLGSGQNPFGIGARLGLPLSSWVEHQLYGRYDVRLGGGRRLLLNPALFYHVGNSPNGANPGRFLALVQGVGLLLEGEHVSVVPALSIVAGRGERRNAAEQIGPFTGLFAAASVNLTWHRPRGLRSRP